MTVTDAGVWIRAIVDEVPGGPVRKRLMTHASVASPALIDLEFTNVLRGLVRKKSIHLRQAELALTEFVQAPIQRYGHLALLDRIWRLRANLTAYDASYIALAELLGVDLLTIDKRLAGVPGIQCHVEVL
ncbi:MAG TPA: type II toxin-antitoxin system VapC family toxin [Candidatus Dormibacteraeota bacterium]|nr:type II toxin-antitoxin system VapC family toxin [Candidatus Dormibacteraeota bacterium]